MSVRHDGGDGGMTGFVARLECHKHSTISTDNNLLPHARKKASVFDRPELVAVFQQHGLDASSLIGFAPFAAGASYRLTVPGVEAVATWQTLRGLVDVTGYWPVMAGGPPRPEKKGGRGGQGRQPEEKND